MATYKMRGVKKMVTREKSGPSKKQIKELPSFANLRRRNAELGGCAAMGKWVRAMLYPIRHMANYNFSGPLNGMLLKAQQNDTVSEWGQRSILLSKTPWLLQGFNLNENIVFDSIVRIPITYILNRELAEIRLTLPALLPGLTLQVPGNYAAYSLVATLGVVPDFHFDSFRFSENRAYKLSLIDVYRGSWHPCTEGSPGEQVTLKLPEAPPDTAFSLLAGIGIQFGTLIAGNKIEVIKHTGAAKILATG